MLFFCVIWIDLAPNSKINIEKKTYHFFANRYKHKKISKKRLKTEPIYMRGLDYNALRSLEVPNVSAEHGSDHLA